MAVGRVLALAAIIGTVRPAVAVEAPSSGPPTTPFRVMTYNIHHGEGNDGRVDLERIAAVIREARADLVALQEVDRGVQRTGRRDLPAELAKLTGLRCLFSNNYHYQGGEYGNAVLTRFPVRQWTNTHLHMLRPGEQRGVLQVQLEVQGRELLFLNTHIDYRPDDAERLANVAQFKGILTNHTSDAVVFAGDFNDRPGSRTYQAMAELCDDAWLRGGERDGFTIPSAKPNRRIDYLWLRKGAALRPVRAWVPATEASDHRPVVVELIWDPPVVPPRASARAARPRPTNVIPFTTPRSSSVVRYARLRFEGE